MRPPFGFVLTLKVIAYFWNGHSNEQIQNPMFSVAGHIGNLHGYNVDITANRKL
jgi:hypothetical protein